MENCKQRRFTFQYGQIYYQNECGRLSNIFLFTFQYGQIYYQKNMVYINKEVEIYIPIWLDLLLERNLFVRCLKEYLHSNMVRFIIFYQHNLLVTFFHLHSNMVRFIIISTKTKEPPSIRFTFQYGQIYYHIQCHFAILKSSIYIPIWLDLLCSQFNDFQKC